MNFPELSPEGLQIVTPLFIYQNEGGWNWSSERAGYWNLWICLDGFASIFCDGVEYKVQPWTAFLFDPESMVVGNQANGSKAMQNCAVHFRLSPQDSELLRGQVLGQLIRETDTAHSLVTAAIRLTAFKDTFSRRQSRFFISSLIALLWREHLHPTETNAELVIYRQLERIQAGQEMFRSVQELALEAGLSRIHYGRCFRRITSESPNRYLIQKRIERAKILLKNTEWPMDRIARAIGYSELYFFSRQFRREVGVSPTEFRA